MVEFGFSEQYFSISSTVSYVTTLYEGLEASYILKALQLYLLFKMILFFI